MHNNEEIQIYVLSYIHYQRKDCDKYFTKEENYILLAVFSSRFSGTENKGCDSTN